MMVADNSTRMSTSRSTTTKPILTGPAEWKVEIGVTPQTLLEQWHTQRERRDIIAFYHEGKGNPWREFSNFYQRGGHSFDFVLPQELFEIGAVEERKRILFAPVTHCDFSEKAIMLCKAAVMGDSTSYDKIAGAETPQEAKRLGRRIAPWDEEKWTRVICGVAVAVLRQKFVVPELRHALLSTGDKVLCEATAGDRTWAIGVSIKMHKVYEIPSRWKGSNVLGWALMQVRAILREEDDGFEEVDDYTSTITE